MASVGKDPRIDLLSRDILPRQIRHILHTDPSSPDDVDRIYHRALGALVDHLLSAGGEQPSQGGSADFGLSPELENRTDREIGVMTPQEVGELYERLRGFRAEMKSDDRPVVTPSSRSRRNQGLFYTPIAVVRHIVTQTLDAIDTGNPSDYLDCRILDPAVGTGIFLGEVLEQIVQRVLQPRPKGSSRVHSRMPAIEDLLTGPIDELSLHAPLDDETAVRFHILRQCLYGVDPDPIAVRIAGAHLVKTALRGFPFVPSLTLRVHVANSLIGAGPEWPDADSMRPDPDGEHAAAYFGRKRPDDETVNQWKDKVGVFHWPLSYPEVFGSERAGFDAIVGNPPYEIVSVKESGIEERRNEQAYFRRMYRTCQGKLNTYRLMLERSINLLRPGGALGFIIPATLLADSTAGRLRRLIFDETEVLQTVIIPESARLFDGVTQALLILITRKGGTTHSVNPTMWDGRGPVSETEGTRVPRELIKEPDFRVPLIRSAEEKALLEVLARHPPFRGRGAIAAAADIHQGEVNLTVHRRFITTAPTGMPLIRGEHVEPFRVAHPSVRPGRFDWVLSDFTAQRSPRESNANGTDGRTAGDLRSGRGRPWEGPRIALARVVNLATKIRLKAAPVPAGSFLGDMTNSVTDFRVSEDFLLGLLNSRLLNWRFKRTSSNNYLSAAEIEALPIPRTPDIPRSDGDVTELRRFLDGLIARRPHTVTEALALLKRLPDQAPRERTSGVLELMIEWVTERIRASATDGGTVGMESLRNVLDSLVVKLYSAESFTAVLQDEE